jgi:hypothetical protein
MNFKKSALASAITLATFATGAAAFDASSWEVSGFVKNETAALQKDGRFIGQAERVADNSRNMNESADVIKFENTAKLFINGDLTENAALHAELNFVYDTEATPNDYQGHMNYSQNDYLRELYIDTMVGDTEVRVGKQQVVWGTADGIKLLDIINPTDYREFAQNTMEDSRIPVWMVKTDTYIGDNGSLQLVLSQPEENKIAGLNSSGDQGNPFIMKGVDTISGKVNGFYNVARGIGSTAASFNAAAAGGLFFGNYYDSGLVGFSHMSVDGFSNGFWTYNGSAISGAGSSSTNTDTYGGYLLNQFTNSGMGSGDSNAQQYTRNVIDATTRSDLTNPGTSTATNAESQVDYLFDPADANSAFEYMSNASFATFNTFTSQGSPYFSGTSTEWVKKDQSGANFGGRYKGSTDNGFNFSLNYFNHLSANPAIKLDWVNSSGALLSVERYGTTSATVDIVGGTASGYVPDIASGTLSRDAARAYFDPSTASLVNILVTDGSSYYGAYDPTQVDGTAGAGAPNLRFTEEYHRVNSLGGSFDYTVDSDAYPVVVRGEFLYEKGEKQPVIDKFLLSIGDLTNALTMRDADYFKYVIGADVTLLTNMLVSGQFIQFRNLDYVDSPDSCTTATSKTVDCGIYTADMATMHMSNGMQKARENKEFYSLFLSKPFGPNQLGRWNNIFMFEEGGGKWNRFDVEYSFSDELVGSFELNNYWGDANTQFGQMEDSSNIQVGLKYLF